MRLSVMTMLVLAGTSVQAQDASKTSEAKSGEDAIAQPMPTRKDVEDAVAQPMPTKKESAAQPMPTKKEGENAVAQPMPTKKERLKFVKGNLTSAGSSVRIPRRSEYGVRLGIDTIGEDIYFNTSPELHIVRDAWRLGFHLPLRAPLYSPRAGEPTLMSTQSFTIRPEDYDQPEDFIAAMLYAQYGNKEDPLFLSFSRVGAASLGHGTILRRFNPNLTTDTTYTSVSLDAYTKHGGFQAFASSVPSPYLFGALGFIKPIGAISDSDPTKSPAGLRSLSIGLTYVQDRSAPKRLDSFCADGSNSCATPTVRLDKDAGYLPKVLESAAVSATGVDVEYKAYKSEDAKTDIKVYADWSLLSVEGGSTGSGGAAGVLARLNFGEGKSLTAMRLRAETRLFNAGYVPSYFDSLYAQQRYQVRGQDGSGMVAPTKLTWLNGLSQDADASKMRFGYAAEIAFAKPRSYGFQASYENATVIDGVVDDNRYQHLMLHAEMPLLFLELFGTYHLRGFDSFSEAFKFEKDNQILVAAVRYKLFPFLAFNLRARKNFSTEAYGDGVEGQVRQEEIEGGFQNVWDYGIDMQLGAAY